MVKFLRMIMEFYNFNRIFFRKNIINIKGIIFFILVINKYNNKIFEGK